MWHKPCRTFHPWCLCIKTRCLYRILMNISNEHFLNTTPRDLFHSIGWYQGLILNNPTWNMISRGKFSSHCKCVIYTSTYVIRSHLVHSTCEVRKLKYCVWARLVKRPDDQCLWTSISVISDYTITGSTPDFCKAGELTHRPLVMHICASVLDPGNGSACI